MSEQYEKIFLIEKLMNSYIEANLEKDDKWLVDKFDKLYEMSEERLKYLAIIRGVKEVELIS